MKNTEMYDMIPPDQSKVYTPARQGAGQAG